MTPHVVETSSLYGYLTIFEAPHGGFLGGALVVNQRGRPVEFHCTDTLLVSRAEEILYGRTLRPHLFCERLGASLLAKVAPRVEVVLINQPELLPLAEERPLAGKGPLPVVLVTDPVEPAPEEQGTRPSEPLPIRLDQVEDARREEVTSRLASLGRYVPLAEPFSRIIDALAEAGRIAPVEEALHDQAA